MEGGKEIKRRNEVLYIKYAFIICGTIVLKKNIFFNIILSMYEVIFTNIQNCGILIVCGIFSKCFKPIFNYISNRKNSTDNYSMLTNENYAYQSLIIH